MQPRDLREVETHFKFGENWKSFVQGVDQASLDQAVVSLEKLFPNGELQAVRLLDIGCGSGMSMLAASRLGAAFVQGVDIDPNSVQATHTLLGAQLDAGRWAARVTSVFDLTPEQDGLFDVVHSWGVLHHTGDMWPAIDRALSMVRPGGLAAIALYRKTPLCGFWAWEKRLYTQSGPLGQWLGRVLYKSLYCLALVLTGRNPKTYIKTYGSARGMDWHHDVHDWLGGYPYQSVTPDEIRNFLHQRGFSIVRAFEKPAAAKGVFGTHCDEIVAIRDRT